MLFWGYGEIARLREMRQRGATINQLVIAWPAHSRDEVIEAYWAQARIDNLWRALDHANMCIAAAGVTPMINGSPARDVDQTAPQPLYAPQF